MSVSVSVGGSSMYRSGFGYSDVENLVPVSPDTSFRIASISKCFTSLIVARLVEQGKLDLDADIRQYLSYFPAKTVDGKEAKITPRMLLNHTSGIRHYKNGDEVKSDSPELLLNTSFEDTRSACKLFENDPLEHFPGEKFTYSTFAFTLLAAVIEAVSDKNGPAFARRYVTNGDRRDNDKKKEKQEKPELPKHARFDSQLKELFRFLGLKSTFLEYNRNIKANPSRAYRRSEKGLLINAPEVDNSYKWAGGGLISTTSDLINLGNHLASVVILSDSLGDGNVATNCLISRSTLGHFWTPCPLVDTGNPNWSVGLGWFFSLPCGSPVLDSSDHNRFYICHTGGAVGASSVLLLSLPFDESLFQSTDTDNSKQVSLLGNKQSSPPPICVAILTNLENVDGIRQLAVDIAALYAERLDHHHHRSINK